MANDAAAAGARKPYKKPSLVAHGALAVVTRAVGTRGRMDGGPMGMRRTGM